ncbi:hypothetical protein HK099_003308 [Clydaea vesicula]|uniref:Phosphatidylserine decarboxylase proenzyme 2 n=1 Tax=Clydaea vesicula TaxID=447962 RepID=A0AAD5U6B9_9FUNG|nr:hypothetical protein HK099_003308 [Clydaea vesicula]
MQSAKLKIVVHEARNLLAADRNGFSDPYVIIKVGPLSSKTNVIHKTLNPCWEYEAEFLITPVMIHADFEILFTCWDKDFLGNDFLGQVRIPIAELGKAKFSETTPTWYPFHQRNFKDKISGDLKISLGFEGSIDDNLKSLIDSFSNLNVHPSRLATITNTEDPADDLYFNNFVSNSHLSSSQDNLNLSAGNKDLVSVSDGAKLNHSDMKGMLTIEIVSAKDLPYEKNSLRTSFNCDPFLVLSFGKKTFKTRSIKHTLNPVWDEKAYIHIKNIEYEKDFSLILSVYDYEKIESNQNIGVAEIKITDLINSCKNPDLVPNVPSKFELVDITLPLRPKNSLVLNGYDAASVLIRVGFVPYKDIRRNFWLSLAEEYDSDGNGTISRIELETLLDSLNSTCSPETIKIVLSNGQFNEELGDDAISFEKLFEVLETNLFLSPKDKSSILKEERLTNINVCPICKKKIKEDTDLDIISHVALCGHEDLSKLDTLVCGGLLTESYASKKWFTKILSYVTYGAYNIGKNSANILVQDRVTGQLIEEKMPSYIRLGIRLLYQTRKGKAADRKTVKKLLKSMSIKQGKKFNAPESVKEIPGFIAFHKLQVDEILDPIDTFKNFNEFFYRKLKPSARVISSIDPKVAVSGADCRLNAFSSISEATRLWIKVDSGENFSIANLLQDPVKAKLFEGGSCCIFRLAPQDYHRFHIPVDGVVGETKSISGEYFTVNPMAIRNRTDVYTENVRKITYIYSDHFGTVAFCAIGAMMVGSIVLTSEENQRVKRMDEHGYFAFGGSTCILLFEPKKILFDSDLITNSNQGLETLVKVGSSLGRAYEEAT